ncbi:hypothetical protein [Acinetobacter sp. ANC 4470]|nr:hypothetical protein [Acinetobacter sp. ANC 4470]
MPFLFLKVDKQQIDDVARQFLGKRCAVKKVKQHLRHNIDE